MKPTTKTAHQAIAVALALFLPLAEVLADGFLDDDLDYWFQLGSLTEVYVSGVRNKAATHITIPPTVVDEYTDGKDEDGNYIVKHRTCRVTGIGRSAFSGCNSLTSVTIPNSVTSIGEEAFFPCRGLTSVTIPDSVTNIGYEAFKSCTGLASVTIGNSVTDIGYEAFYGCSGLTNVKILGNVTNDWDYVYSHSPFYNCTNIATLVLGDKMTKIGSHMFYGCSGLTNMSIPDSVTSIGDSAFAGCIGLTSVTIGSSVTNIGSQAFECCTNLTSVAMPDSVTSIGGWAFCDCNRLTNVTIPDSVTSIGARAFSNCWSLTSVTIPDSVTSIEDSAYSGCNGLTNVTILGNITNVWKHPSVRGVHSPFSSCTNISTLVLGGKMTKIGNYMFAGCRGLTNVMIADSVTDIGDSAFEDCTGLTSLTIPDNVMCIGSYAFYKCRGLRSVTILGNITNDWQQPSGPYSPFSSCTNISTLVLGGKMTKIGNYMFSGCSGLTNVTIPDGVTSIGHEAFSWCSSLKSVTIPDSVASLGWNAFSRCSALTSVTIPDSVTSIGEDAFDWCNSLTNVTFEGAPPSVDSSPFSTAAPGARGYYMAAHAVEWEAVIVDGKWQGLIMEMIGGMIDPPVLQVQSANPAAGSLTLAWEDSCVADGITYSIYRSANDTYSTTDLVVDGLTGRSWTDTTYWSAGPVLQPLNYWVVADGGGYGERVSNREETRHRYALGVGVGRYRDEDTWEPDVSDITNADLFKRLTDEGGFTTAVLSGSKATHEGIREQMRDLSSKAKTGDYLFVFCSSHGKTSWWRALAEAAGTTSLLEFQGVAMYDTVDKVYTFDHIYAPDEIKADLEACLADKNGVSLVFILNCCMSGGVTANSPSNGDMAWITSCQEKALTPTWPRIGTPLPKYFFDYGWQQGMAGDTEYLSLANLLDYALPQLEVFFSKVNEHNTPVVKGRGILEHFIVGQPGNATHTSEPDVPTGLSASLSGKELTVQWNNDTKADYFIVRRTNATGDNNPLVYVGSGSSEVFSFQDKEASWFGTPYLYRVAAMNEWGISEWSDPRLGACMWKEWMDWIGPYFGFEEVSPEDLAAAAIATSANGATYATCYVAGLDPNDPNAAFTAELVREDGKWKAKPKGGEKEGRVYRVEGKKEMSDEAWTDVTTVEDLEAEGWHFFRVGVELAE